METINDRIEQLVNHQFNGNKAKFCKTIGLPPSGLSNYIGHSRRSKPSVDMIAKIVERVGVDPLWLLTGREAPVGKIQHVGEGAQLNEAGASGNINAPGLASLSSSLSSSGDVARLEMELKQAEARIAEKDARIADLKEMISQLLARQ